MKKIQTGDNVIVIAGKFKGKTSTVESINGDQVVVKGINVMKKAVKGQGFIDKIHPVHISNIALYDEKSQRGSKVAITTDKDGKKTRTLKTTSTVKAAPAAKATKPAKAEKAPAPKAEKTEKAEKKPAKAAKAKAVK